MKTNTTYKVPDKTLRHNYRGRSYEIRIYAKEDCAYIYDNAYSDPVFKMSPINKMTLVEIGVQAKKGARYLSGIERDYSKLREQGFEFLGAVKPAPSKPAPRNEGSSAKETDPSLPMWARKS